MNVLSLFDGMSCGRLALDRLGVKVDKYYASEIDKYAIAVAAHNYPETQHIGSVVDVNPDDLPHIDLLVGGSPCQGFSFAGHRKGSSTVDGIEIIALDQYLELKEQGFEFDGQSYLFWEYIRILEALKKKNPNIKFLLENVIMTQKWQAVIDTTLGTDAVSLKSSLVVPQNRPRLYWTNIPLDELKQVDYDIADYVPEGSFPSSCGTERNFKKKKIFNTLTATYFKGIRGSGRPAISTAEGFLDDDRSLHRMLTPEECEKLQTVPIGYTAAPMGNKTVSNTQRYRMLGNGWTIDVICHLLKNVKSDKKAVTNSAFLF